MDIFNNVLSKCLRTNLVYLRIKKRKLISGSGCLGLLIHRQEHIELDTLHFKQLNM